MKMTKMNGKENPESLDGSAIKKEISAIISQRANRTTETVKHY